MLLRSAAHFELRTMERWGGVWRVGSGEDPMTGRLKSAVPGAQEMCLKSLLTGWFGSQEMKAEAMVEARLRRDS